MWTVVRMGKFLGADVSEAEKTFSTEHEAREYASKIILKPGVFGVMIEYYQE